MKVRLVAYRKATSSATADSTFNLDLQEEPNISLNFQFSDIKEPESRKASYSQTFKLPFTDNNNEFFQNWYNVNLDTLVFNTRTKFDAVLYYGETPQFEGFLQLKAVYQKAKLYEVVLMSNTADLFSVVGEKKLRDVFLNDDGSYSTELNHTFNNTNMIASWNGSADAFNNSSGTSLRDTTVNVQKVMYPMSLTNNNFYFGQDKRYLRMSSSDISNSAVFPNGVQDAFNYIVPITQFRPALQIKNILRLILIKAGFTYTSSFIDGSYFGKVFMTTGNKLGVSTLPTINTGVINFAGNMKATNNGEWGEYLPTDLSTDCSNYGAKLFQANTDVNDEQNLWNTTDMYFTKTHYTQTQITVKHRVEWQDIQDCSSNTTNMDIACFTQRFDVLTNTPDFTTVYSFTFATLPSNGSGIMEYTLDISSIPVGSSAQIYLAPLGIKKTSSNAFLTLGASASFTSLLGESEISLNWDNYNLGLFGSVVNVPMCIDDTITQKAFLKDLIQRFNLVVIQDPDDPNNLIIEPYNDYLAQSTVKYWTDKLDLDKEIIVKDTTELQKKNILLGDAEDVDYVNKDFKENYPDVNVWGKVNIEVTDNDFATGELKNEPLFSPYINQRVYNNLDFSQPSLLGNMTVQFEYSYNEQDGQFIPTLSDTKPKLFWYNGSATNILDEDDGNTTIYMHDQPVSGETINTFSFTTYPVCTPFDIIPGDGTNPAHKYTLTPANKSLYWNANAPIVGQLSIFNYTQWLGSWFNNALFGYYWKPYLDNIYSSESRIMECYIDLNEVDIFDFKFNDEIFIKDTYWRVLNISNYQVGSNASTKVTLIKVVNGNNNCEDCEFVIGNNADGSNVFGDTFYTWIEETNPSGTPDTTAPNYAGVYATQQDCYSNGGMPYLMGANGSSGLYPCAGQSMSLPLYLRNQHLPRNILQKGQLQTSISSKLGGITKSFVRGSDNTKFSKGLIPSFGDDMVIKYNSKRKSAPQLQGENHRIILTGFTEGNTRGFAFPEGSLNSNPLEVPNNVNISVKVTGIATVIGGSSATYVKGITESFGYHTAFKLNNTATQIGTAGGVQDYSIKEISTTCTLYIDMNDNVLRFGLDDSQTDTKRIWQLTVDLSVNRINYFEFGYDDNFALYQNSQHIELQNGDFLLWN